MLYFSSIGESWWNDSWVEIKSMKIHNTENNLCVTWEVNPKNYYWWEGKINGDRFTPNT